MVATQQVWENHDIGGFRQGKADSGFRFAESSGCILCQAAMTNAKSSSPRDTTSNIPQSPLR
jgi:hypothetical protein